MVQMAVGAAITPFREPLAPLLVVVGAGDVIVALPQGSTHDRNRRARAFPVARLPGFCQSPDACEKMTPVDAAFGVNVRELLMALAAGEPAQPMGGGVARVFRETGAASSRGAVA